MPTNTSRFYCFTLNDYTDDDVNRLLGLEEDHRVKALIAGRETAPSTGRQHLQGYIEFKDPQRLAGVKRILGSNTVHAEQRGGTREQAKQYCEKEGDIAVCFGFSTQRGANRTPAPSKLDEIKTSLDSGVTLRSIAEDNFALFLRHHRALEAYIRLKIEPRNFRTQAIWIYGPTGSGKSRRALEESANLCGGDVAWIPNKTLQWFEPYAGHKGVVLDDFNGSVPIAVMLNVLDRYQYIVPTKGGHVQFRPRIVWITSNFSPMRLYGAEDQFDALVRRLDEIILLE